MNVPVRYALKRVAAILLVCTIASMALIYCFGQPFQPQSLTTYVATAGCTGFIASFAFWFLIVKPRERFTIHVRKELHTMLAVLLAIAVAAIFVSLYSHIDKGILMIVVLTSVTAMISLWVVELYFTEQRLMFNRSSGEHVESKTDWVTT